MTDTINSLTVKIAAATDPKVVRKLALKRKALIESKKIEN